MEAELYLETPNYPIRRLKTVKLDFLPSIGSQYHDTEKKLSYTVASIHFTDDRVIVTMKKNTRNYTSLGDNLIL